MDSGTHLYQLVQVAFALRNPQTTTVPIANANYPTANAGDAVQLDTAQAHQLFRDLATDRAVPKRLLTGSRLSAQGLGARVSEAGSGRTRLTLAGSWCS